MSARIAVAIVLLCTLWMPAWSAQPGKFPNRPVRIVVPSTPGGGLDVLARIMAPRLTERWGEPIVIDNRAGAGGIIGTDIVAKAAPDGHTLLVVTTGFTTNPFLAAKLPYRTPEDFAPITPIGTTPVVLVAHPSFPARTAAELVTLAKGRPGEIIFGSSGTGTGGHLTMTLLERVAGIRFNHVPYKGAGASTAAVVGGEVQLLFTAIGATLSHIKTGRLRALAVTSPTRVPMLPEVPSVVEAGLAGAVMVQWYGFIAPGRTPNALVERIYTDLVAVMKQPEVSAKLQGAGFRLDGMPPAKFRSYLQDEMTKWGAIIRDTGLKSGQ